MTRAEEYRCRAQECLELARNISLKTARQSLLDMADSYRANRAEPAITCETVRAYVSQMGLAAAKAIARANGMTPAQERRARQCLASRD